MHVKSGFGVKPNPYNMSKLTQVCFWDCLLHEGEESDEIVIVEGITKTFKFNAERLEEKFDIILSILEELSDDFKSGYSFLAFHLTKYGKPWTEYKSTCEQLLVLAIGLGLAGFCSPREVWSELPGNAPYIVIN